MYGVFKLGDREVYVRSEDLDRIVEVGEAFPFPGCPHGIDGLIDVKGVYLPLVNRRVVVEEGTSRSQAPLDMAAILRIDGERYAMLIDDVLGLRPKVQAEEATGEPVVIEGRDIWRRVAALNEGPR